ncbi:uncharacterized protein RCO7_11150 [Rhynchosporium graminicola]|uniref:Uncharacterized protein n=1 Tax=Rhynchosporium graminicola TaxID=2792576 RepID=A0A1E1LNQ8_9HELO|nr:uncharacterized protein RCO7_11150 [Rhynchosporium commune]
MKLLLLLNALLIGGAVSAAVPDTLDSRAGYVRKAGWPATCGCILKTKSNLLTHYVDAGWGMISVAMDVGYGGEHCQVVLDRRRTSDCTGWTQYQGPTGPACKSIRGQLTCTPSMVWQ